MGLIAKIELEKIRIPESRVLFLRPDRALLNEIGQIALVYARNLAPERTGELKRSLALEIEEDRSIIRLVPRVSYGYAVERGVRAHVMWYLMGKTIPIRLDDGTLIFRRATRFSYYNKIVKRDKLGRIVPGGVKPGAWRYPKTEGQFFMKKGLEKAWQEQRTHFFKEIVRSLFQYHRSR